MRIIVNAPDMHFSADTGISAGTVFLPVLDAVDSVGKKLFLCLLHTAPEKFANIPVQRVDFLLYGKFRVFKSQKRRLCQAGVVAGHSVNAVALEPVGVVRSGERSGFAVKIAEKPVVPFAFVPDLAVL